MANIPPDLKALSLPLALGAVLILLFILVFKLGLGRINLQQAEVSQNENNQKILSQKESLLREISGQIGASADSLSFALPSKNPALVMMTQFKLLANTKGVVLANLRVGSEVKDAGFSKVTVSVDVDGPYTSVIDFLKGVSGLSPVMSIEKIKVSSVPGGARAETLIKGFWAPHPTKLPSLTDPVKDLSQDEKDIISKISLLTTPPFGEILPQEPTARSDPF